jgi:hypothetical protein
MTVRQTERFVAELSELADEAARAERITEQLEAGPSLTGRAWSEGRKKTVAEWVTEDAETIGRIAARLQTRLLACPLDTLGPPAAALVRAALARLLPVLGALSVTASEVLGEEKAA